MKRDEIADRVSFIRRVPAFSALEDRPLHELLTRCTKVRVHEGANIFRSSEPARSLYVILTGKVKLYQISPKGDEQILHMYGPGNTFGEAAVWAGIRYPAHAEALVESTLLEIPRVILSEYIRNDPDLAFGMLSGMSRKLMEFNTLIEQLSLKEIPARLAGVLLRLSEESESDSFRLEQTKRELASQIGTISETLSRTLYKMKKKELILVDGDRITILNRNGLEELAES